jgi:mycofactocin system glycosyltransferase
MTALPLPHGFHVVLDESVRAVDSRTWSGGSPNRLLRLTRAGQVTWGQLRRRGVTSVRAGTLARRLTDAGLAHPRPPRLPEAAWLTVVVPTYERPRELDRCLRALGRTYPVVVVDDASTAADAVAEVAARHGARLVHREINGGPGPARDSGIAAVDTEFVALIDSDCVPDPDSIARLVAHFRDPLVGAVAPRVVPLDRRSVIGRYAAVNGSLDLGPTEARVLPRGRVSYVPTAALLVRRRAIEDIRVGGAVFDPQLRYGEDVDMVWRLHAAGWRVRYDPRVRIAHEEPTTWSGLLMRRFRYGTSAGPLAERHGSAVAPLVLYPWPLLTVLGLLAKLPAVALLGGGGAVGATLQVLRRVGLPTVGMPQAVAASLARTWLGVGRYATQFASPILVTTILRSRGRGRLLPVLLLAAPPLASWLDRRPRLDPLRFAVAHVADDIAYGTGVWIGSIRARTAAAVLFEIPRRPRLHGNDIGSAGSKTTRGRR